MNNEHSSDNHECLQSLIEVFLFIDGQLDADRENEINEHLKHCEKCYGRVEFERLIKGYVKKRSHSDKASDTVMKNVSDILG